MTPAHAPDGRGVTVAADTTELSAAAARVITAIALESVARRGRFTIALSGGETPRATYDLLAARFAGGFPWDVTDVFFCDERCVPADDPRSNYGMVSHALLDRVPLAASRIHSMDGTRARPAEGAARYEFELRSFFSTPSGKPPIPMIDLSVLGVGADGHTASLFPGDRALANRRNWAVAVSAPDGTSPRDRISLTIPVLNASRRVLFLVAGAGKRAIISKLLAAERPPGADSYPAALVRGVESTEWIIDSDAAP